MRKKFKFGFCFSLLFIMFFSIIYVNAEILSASKTLSTGDFSGTCLKMTATASCPNSGTFKWTTSQKESYKVGGGYSAYTTQKKWDANNSTKKAKFTWSYQILKLPTGSGVATKYASSTKYVDFIYNSSQKSLTVK